ncbi:protein FAM47E isoform X2 [Brienomyrus brachyistius]|uniref:protein FAM47E isoform X2 n=1 Tax=Brienomyrus brachyistius TaxID=42636 RepID=UPI0020B35FB1|nr:protein FAM47E isoform X2 [Brienomyrus brachyistius]
MAKKTPFTDRSSLHPWYKERLPSRYMRENMKIQQPSGVLDSGRWHFLQPGLDGLMAARPSGSMQTQREVCPSLHRNTGSACASTSSNKSSPQKRFSKEQVYLSKQNPQQLARREHLAQVEQRLSQHPLALHQFLKESMPPELFIEVASLLEPEMPVDSDEVAKEEHCAGDVGSQCETETREVTVTGSAHSKPDRSRPGNPHLWKVKGSMNPCGVQGWLLKSRSTISQDEDTQKAISQLCSFIASLPGESGDLDEATLQDLFDSSYERKQSQTFPIQVVSPSSAAGELRRSPEDPHRVMTHDIPSNQEAPEISWKQTACEDDVPEDQGLMQPSLKDEELKQLPVTLAFKEFIHRKGLREPRFLRALFSNEEQKDKRTRSFMNTMTST